MLCLAHDAFSETQVFERFNTTLCRNICGLVMRFQLGDTEETLGSIPITDPTYACYFICTLPDD